ncbi:NADH:flavin oxidoreductase/NADH oxidase [Polynucleobacter sp. MWH-Spelu-300-X4]|uniref:NADH:flavin oxidoreductase/NADH oxidase n=1 Tax=Polynucleobacter sp. MWH-Spelu-300-X4 TaxID=2689109 RepID=UPI002111F55E|nr:NADH:flavin oxidoreductase/NADH oxidase [Polynucleobacter sp. MWH-Spelu-300-X4]
MSQKSQLFSKLHLSSPRGGIDLDNRVIVAPMCQYASENGLASDWHLMHWGNLLNSGAGMFIIEATAVVPEGRITPHCLGLWDDQTEAALADKLHRAKALAPKVPVCIQLAHAGRKASSAAPWNGGQLLPPQAGGWVTVAPSALPQLEAETSPHALTVDEMNAIKLAFANAAKRADRIGIDAIELHGAHGYLMHQFLSPVANKRDDQYGGSLENRMRFPLEVFKAVREVYAGVLGIRVSASDWMDEGLKPEEVVQFGKQLKALGCDFIHVSSGGISPKQKIALGPNYQVPFAQLIKAETGLTTFAVGMITGPQQAEDILSSGQADAVALARAFLYKPRWAWEAAGVLGGKVAANPRYWRCLPKEAQDVFLDIHMGQR